MEIPEGEDKQVRPDNASGRECRSIKYQDHLR
jgi:hypothetical protein